jgi:sugar phosphate isomerase/epimerase
MPKPNIGEGCSFATHILWEEDESKSIRKRIIALSDKQIENLFKLSGLKFFYGPGEKEIPWSEIIAEIRKVGIDHPKLICLLDEGFLGYHVDGTELIKQVEQMEKKS